MLRSALIATLLLLLVALTCVMPASATTIVTAANRAMAPSDVNTAAIVEIQGSPANRFDRQLAQTFLAEESGILQRVAVTAGARYGAAQSDGLGLQMAISPYNPENGQLGEALSIEPVEDVELLPGVSGPFSQVDVLQATANFESSGIVLNAGSSYAMIFSAERFEDSFFILGGTLPDYEEGRIGVKNNDQPFQFYPTTDLFFEVTVNPVPEPTTLVVLLTTLPLTLLRRR